MVNGVLKIVAAGLMLVLLGQPLAACVISGHTMTAAEHACCMKMASMCESTAMPLSHSCCRQAASPQVVALAKTWSGDISVPVVLASKIAPALPPSPSVNALYSNSPPGSPPKLSTVLRI